MITISINLNGEETKKQLPTSWNDLSFKDFVGLIDLTGNDADTIAFFTGVDKDTILKAKIEGLENILFHLEFLKEPPVFDKAPKLFLGAEIPEDITFKSLAPYVDCKNILSTANGVKEFTEAYAKYCAIYVQAIKADWENYDYDKAMELVPEVMNQPASEVVGLGSFFIPKLLPSRKNTQDSSPAQG